MAKIADNTLNTFVDGKVVRDVDLNPKMEIIKTAINANADDIAARYTKAESDAKMNTAVGSRIVAAGTAFPAGPYIDGQDFYRTDLKQRFTYDLGTAAWHPTNELGVGQVQTSNLDATLTGNTYGGSQTFTPATLSRGQQAVTTTRRAPFAVLNLRGRTLVNLLGRDGNCETTAPWSTSQSTVALDTTNVLYGINSFKATISATYTFGTVWKNVAIKGGKYYIVLVAIKNGNATNAQVRFNGVNGGQITGTDKFYTSYLKTNPASDTTATLDIIVTGAANQYAYMDGYRVYEVDQATYNKIGDGVTTGYQTADDLDKLFPYVDDVKHIANPYIVKQGKNLLPPFTEWALTSPFGVVEAYKALLIATATWTPATVDIQVLANQQYTLTVDAAVGSYVAITRYNSDGTAGSDITNKAVTVAGLQTINFTTDAAVPLGKLRVHFSNGTNTSGTFTFNKPMLNLGSTGFPFEPQNQDVLFIPTALASSVDGTVYDTVYERDGAIWKNKRFVTDVALDASLAWAFAADKVGYKVANVTIVSYKPNQFTGVKFDGKILVSGSVDTASDYIDFDNPGKVYVSISDTDSGWGDAYTAVTSDEIKAYFNGWKASTVDAGGKPTAWVSLGDATAAPTQTLAYVSTNRAPKAVPYKLTYQLATEQPEVILSEGQISLHDGLNQVEFGEGLIVREVANPAINGSTYWINANSMSGSYFKYRADRVLTVYKNGVKDGKWKIYVNDSTAYGKSSASIAQADFDPTAEYTVTYYALDKYAVSSNVVTLDGQYAANLKTVVDQNVQNIADTKRQVDALAITVDDMRTKVSEEPWIAPTLANGWVNVGTGGSTAGYYKDSLGIVRVRGQLKSGTVTAGTILFTLPAGYRPILQVDHPIKTLNGATLTMATLVIRTNGEVAIYDGAGNSALMIDGITFRAEQ